MTFARRFPTRAMRNLSLTCRRARKRDCFARYLIRVAEMRESLKIVRQAMEKIPGGRAVPHRSAGHRSAGPRKDEDGDGSAHLPLQDFHRRICAAAGRSVCIDRIAARRIGLLSWRAMARRSRCACHFRSPSFINLQALPKLIEGQLISDVIACIGTIDIVLGDVDR